MPLAIFAVLAVLYLLAQRLGIGPERIWQGLAGIVCLAAGARVAQNERRPREPSGSQIRPAWMQAGLLFALGVVLLAGLILRLLVQ